MGKRTELVNVLNAQALTVNGTTQFSTQFPLGEGWYTMYLRFNIVVTIGTGTGAIVEGLQRLVENILFTTDVDNICVNAPGRALWRRAQLLDGGSPPFVDTLAAATATYRLMIPIHFADPRMIRPEDSILDTSRYSSVNLQISLGGVSRLFSTVGTSSITATLDCDIERAAGPLSDASAPMVYPFIVSKPSVDPNNQSFIDLERAGDLGIKRLMLFTSDNATPFQGVADSAVLARLSIEDQDSFVGLHNVADDTIQRKNVTDYSIDGGALLAGIYIHDYVKQGSINDSEYTGSKSRYQVTYTNDTPAGRFVHTLVDGVRGLKALSVG